MKIVRLLAVMLGLALASGVQAKEVDGIPFDDTIELAGEELVLNGTGWRTKFFVDVYIGALYLPRRAQDPDTIYAMDGAKRILLHFVYSEVSKEQLVDAWRGGLEDNVEEAEREAIKTEFQQFLDLFGGVTEDQRLIMDLLPDGNTRVTIAGEERGSVQSEALQTAVLKIFLGPDPADSDLKEGMLGKE